MDKISDFFEGVGMCIVAGVIINEIIDLEKELKAQRALEALAAQQQLEENLEKAEEKKVRTRVEREKQEIKEWEKTQSTKTCSNPNCHNLLINNSYGYHSNGECDDCYYDDSDDD
jgi:hypothetical protein